MASRTPTKVYGPKAAFIMYATGGAEDFRGGVLKFLEQKKGDMQNCFNISWWDAYFL